MKLPGVIEKREALVAGTDRGDPPCLRNRATLRGEPGNAWLEDSSRSPALPDAEVESFRKLVDSI
jgi:hypothetical protein